MSQRRRRRRRRYDQFFFLLHLSYLVPTCHGMCECRTNSVSASFICCVQASLERGVAVCRGTSEEEMVIFETETMSMAMGLLTAVMAGAIKVHAL